jgi:uncharacterized membrane protein YdjX (TVP38/TMEM64 family)
MEIPKLLRHPAVKIFVALTLLGLLVTGLSVIFNRVVEVAGEELLVPLLVAPVLTFVVYFLLATLATVVVPLPTLPIDVLLMTMFNPWLVLVVRLGASLVGSSLNFTLGRTFGEPLLAHLMSKENLKQTVEIAKNVNRWQYFLMAMFPLINPELVAYAAGLSTLRIWELMPIVAAALFYRLLIVLALVRW